MKELIRLSNLSSLKLRKGAKNMMAGVIFCGGYQAMSTRPMHSLGKELHEFDLMILFGA